MLRTFIAAFALIAAASPCIGATGAQQGRFALAIHGGAGDLKRESLPPAKEAQYREALGAALDAGYAVLEKGGTSLDAVTTVVRILEDDPLFNAGRGAVLNSAGEVELDAAIMDGRTLAAGAVADIRHVRNPIELARRVMERSAHVMLVGEGAEAFAVEQGLQLVPNDWFRTEERRRELERVRGETAALAPPAAAFGTVGAVAMDVNGNLAAATSTGGMTNKRPGRVGDSPIIGAGTYANNASCAVSATGHGEYFIRAVVAYDICARMQYGRATLANAVRDVVHGELKEMGGAGGVIAIDARGSVVLAFNTSGMYRALRTSDGRREIGIFP